MRLPVQLSVIESLEDLKKLMSKAAVHNRPRLKMLILIVKGVHANGVLAAKTGVGIGSIMRWKQTYTANGLEGLLSDKRGGDFCSSIDPEKKKKLEAKLSDPNDAFTSFGQAQAWIKEHLGVDMKYHAVNKYLKRNFGARLKVGRKSHVKKDPAAVAVFKNTGSGT